MRLLSDNRTSVEQVLNYAKSLEDLIEILNAQLNILFFMIAVIALGLLIIGILVLRREYGKSGI